MRRLFMIGETVVCVDAEPHLSKFIWLKLGGKYHVVHSTPYAVELREFPGITWAPSRFRSTGECRKEGRLV